MRSSLFHRALLAAALTLPVAAPTLAAEPLKLEAYNPGNAAIFPVSSTLVIGEKEVILIDAQFGKSQAEQVVAKIRASGKRLALVFISHSDPDYYFGLATIKAAYPEVKVLASAPTVAHIKATSAGKLAFWGPKLGADAPATLVVPEVLAGDSFTLEGQKLQILGLDSPNPERNVLWIPSLKAVVGGILLMNQQHVWMADTQTPASHADWLKKLDAITKLQPRAVYPGHALPAVGDPLAPVKFTADYIRAFDEETPKAKNSAELIAAMKKRYPSADEVSSLELSAKVAKGEMKWPAGPDSSH